MNEKIYIEVFAILLTLVLLVSGCSTAPKSGKAIPTKPSTNVQQEAVGNTVNDLINDIRIEDTRQDNNVAALLNEDDNLIDDIGNI